MKKGQTYYADPVTGAFASPAFDKAKDARAWLSAQPPVYGRKLALVEVKSIGEIAPAGVCFRETDDAGYVTGESTLSAADVDVRSVAIDPDALSCVAVVTPLPPHDTEAP